MKNKNSNTPAKPIRSTTEIKKGDLVKIVGSRYYSGGTISTWIKSQLWRVKEVRDTEVILENEDSAPIFGSVNIAELQVIESPKVDDKDK